MIDTYPGSSCFQIGGSEFSEYAARCFPVVSGAASAVANRRRDELRNPQRKAQIGTRVTLVRVLMHIRICFRPRLVCQVREIRYHRCVRRAHWRFSARSFFRQWRIQGGCQWRIFDVQSLGAGRSVSFTTHYLTDIIVADGPFAETQHCGTLYLTVMSLNPGCS